MGREPQPVEPKVLLPLVQAAALEAEETLSAKWAALLANASDPAKLVDVTPAFVEVMRQLTPLDTLILNRLYFHRNGRGEFVGGLSRVDTFYDTEMLKDFSSKGEGGGPKQGDVLKFSKWIHVLKMQLVHRKQSVSAWGR